MTTHADTVARNATSRQALAALVDRLTTPDLLRDLGDGWTVAMALGHLAFWDGRQLGALQLFSERGEVLGEEDSDATNAGLEPLLGALDPAVAGSLAIEAADAVNAYAATFDWEAAARTLGDPAAHLPLARWSHREEHIAQIEAALRS
jgi:hypothetical protein